MAALRLIVRGLLYGAAGAGLFAFFSLLPNRRHGYRPSTPAETLTMTLVGGIFGFTRGVLPDSLRGTMIGVSVGFVVGAAGGATLARSVGSSSPLGAVVVGIGSGIGCGALMSVQSFGRQLGE